MPYFRAILIINIIIHICCFNQSNEHSATPFYQLTDILYSPKNSFIVHLARISRFKFVRHPAEMRPGFAEGRSAAGQAAIGRRRGRWSQSTGAAVRRSPFVTDSLHGVASLRSLKGATSAVASRNHAL